jgi:hypothetical protein
VKLLLMIRGMNKMANSFLVQQTSSGEPVVVGDVKVYPVARSYRINFPSDKGGISWNRPLAVIVEDSQGSRQVIPVQDRTRQLQVGILLAGLFGTILTWLILRQSRSFKQKKENTNNG